jgi:hypothetical protein
MRRENTMDKFDCYIEEGRRAVQSYSDFGAYDPDASQDDRFTIASDVIANVLHWMYGRKPRAEAVEDVAGLLGHAERAWEGDYEDMEPESELIDNPLVEALQRIQAIRDEYVANGYRAVLHIAWNHEDRDEDGELYVTDDPYNMSDGEVLELWKTKGDEIQTYVYEHGSGPSGEDYETLDSNEGALEGLERALDVLQIMAHGGTPAQGEEVAS